MTPTGPFSTQILGLDKSTRDCKNKHLKDGNLRMSTLISQFSGACGLRFRNKETGAMRGVRVNNDLFLPPNGAMGWPTDVTFNVVYRFVYKLPCHGPYHIFSKDNAANREKRKILDQNPEVEFAQSQPPKRATQKPSDLAVLRFDPYSIFHQIGRVFPMVGVSILPHAALGHAELGPTDHREDASHFIFLTHISAYLGRRLKKN